MKLFRFTLLGCLLVSVSLCYAQESPRKKINFDEDWKFHFGNAADPSKRF